MKKVFFFAIVQVFALLAMAQKQTFQGDLKVVDNTTGGAMINTSQKDVPLYLIDNSNETYAVELHNFSIDIAGSVMDIGNITIPELKVTEQEGVKILNSSPQGDECNILLSDGDDPAKSWLGSTLGNFQGEVTGSINGNNLQLSIPLVVKMGFMTLTLAIDFNGMLHDSAGIGNIRIEDTDTTSFTVHGIRAAKTYKGIVIHNGKKYVAK